MLINNAWSQEGHSVSRTAFLSCREKDNKTPNHTSVEGSVNLMIADSCYYLPSGFDVGMHELTYTLYHH